MRDTTTHRTGSDSLRWCLIMIVVGLPGVRAAQAIDFDVDLAASSGLTPSDSPVWDMVLIVNKAADYWEKVFADASGSYNVKCEFNHNASRAGEFEVNKQIGGSYKIKFFVDYDDAGLDLYYFDDAPGDHSEYALQQTVYADTGSGFGGSPEAYLDVSYSGTPDPSSAIADQIDLYTQALRALAGVMGFRQQDIGRSLAEQHLHDFGDYQVDDDFNAGSGVSVFVCNPCHFTPDPYDICGCPASTVCWIDLCIDSLLVDETFEVGARHLPSAADALVVAAINGWLPNEVRLPRVDMLPNVSIAGPAGGYTSTYDWHEPENWIGGRVPENFSEAYLRTGLGVVWLEGNAGAGGLHVHSDNALLTNGHALTIDGPIAVYDVDSLVSVQSDDLASAELLTVQAGRVEVHTNAHLNFNGTSRRADGRPYGQIVDGGTLQVWTGEIAMPNGILDVDDGVLELTEDGVVEVAELSIAGGGDAVGASLGVVRGDGVVRDIQTLLNNGLIEAIGELQLISPAGWFDLDGSESPIGDATFGGGPSGEIDATQGSLRIEGSTGGDAFDGLLTVARPYVVELTEPWGIGESGEVNVQSGSGSSGGPARLRAPITTVYGKISVSAPGAELINDMLLFESGTHLEVSGHLALQGTVRYGAGDAVYIGSGSLHQCGNASVHADTTIQFSSYIWDGEGWSSGSCAGGNTTIFAGNELTVTGQISTTAGDGYDGSVTVQNGAQLSMDQDWQLDGSAVLQGGTVATGGGAGRLTVASGGTIFGEGVINSDVHLDHGATLEGTGSGIQICGNLTGPGTTTGTVSSGGC